MPVEPAQPRRVFLRHLADQAGAVGLVERRPQRQQLVERQPQRVEVGPGVARALKPLRRHVPQRADDVAGVRQVLGAGRLGQPEVGHPDVALAIQEQVRRLDVAVEDALAVGMRERLGHLDPDPRHTLCEPPVGLGER